MQKTLLAVLLLTFAQTVFAQTGYFRYPSAHNNTLVFTAEGDLWRWQQGNSKAQRLTTHTELESQASISPDGKQVAFVAGYDGYDEAYVMPISGGTAKRITFEDNRVKVQGWTPDGKVLYVSSGGVGPGFTSIKTVDPKTLKTRILPLADVQQGAVSQNNKTLFFVQHGLQKSTDNAHAYNGGATGELWSFRLGKSREAKHLTAKHSGSVRSPMPFNGRVYFISNQSGIDNIWSMTFDGDDLQQHTRYKNWNIRDTRMHNGVIAYQLGADIYRLDVKTNQAHQYDIELMSDFAGLREHWVNKPMNYLTHANLAHNDKKLVITARGRVAIANTEGMRLVEIATPQESRTRAAILGPKGKWVYALNDASGEVEIWRFAADGSRIAKQLTQNGSTLRYNLHLSPDGKWIANDDKNGDLWLYNIKSGKNKKVVEGNASGAAFDDLVWSADSKFIAVTRSVKGEDRSRIEILDVTKSRRQLLTSSKYRSYSPTFSVDGKWLYFLSERKFDSRVRAPWGDRNFGAHFDKRTEVYALALDADAEFPFKPSSELDKKDKSADEKEEKDDKAIDKNSNKIDWKGIAKRLWRVPVKAGNYSNLSANKGFLYLMQHEASGRILQSVSIGNKAKSKTFKAGVRNYELSADGKYLLLQKNKDNFFIVKAGATYPSSATDVKVKTSDWKLLVNPKQEWQQIFRDAWLMHRDSLFDPDMRGLNWIKVKQKYQPLLARVTDRHELNDVFKQMMGELNTLHSQVRGGDINEDKDKATPASLGAELVQVKGGMQIKHIFTNDPELPKAASPLNQPGVNAQNGDVIFAINGKKITTQASVALALRNQAGKQVLLSLQRKGKAHQTIVKPASARQNSRLAYEDWVYTNLLKVQKANNDIGYLHLYAMGSRDIATFAREFYAQYDKPAMIIDVRRNRGGNIDSWIIEKLLRKTWSFWQTKGEVNTNMQQTFRGHLVVLADEFTYSDGETFTSAIKTLGLGTVIGKQTAGAGVWLTGRNRQSDNGIARAAEFPVFALDGRWIVEGTGVKPDIEVTNYPHATFEGKDAQLQRAISFLKKKMRQQPLKKLKAKDLPNKPAPADTPIKQ